MPPVQSYAAFKVVGIQYILSKRYAARNVGPCLSAQEQANAGSPFQCFLFAHLTVTNNFTDFFFSRVPTDSKERDESGVWKSLDQVAAVMAQRESKDWKKEP